MKKTITVNAGEETVWKSIVSYRESQPHRRRLISKTENIARIEESFTGLPLVGSASVVYEEIEYPFNRIDFQLIESEHLSKFNGSWSIVANADGETSDIHLTAEFDIHLQLPFKEAIVNQLAEMDSAKRLEYVKRTAESQS